MGIKDKVVVITGAGGVLCSEFARAVARAGGKVALLNRSADKIERLATEIGKAGGIALPYPVNVLDVAGLKDVHERIRKDLGPCDILINGAGGNMDRANTTVEYFEQTEAVEGQRTFFELDEEHIDAVFKLNFTGTLLPTKEFARDMLGRSGCSILNVSSMASYHPMTKVLGYAGAKAAINNLTEWLAVHFAKEGIRVNAIAPGFFSTAQNRNLLFDKDGNYTARSHKILAGTPMGRFGEPKELLGGVLFLIDAEVSGFVTGIVLPVDGGFLAYSGV
ncbi:MAG TPA: D-mannonate oxidoreductase [Sphaerochaeta sp.]|jgi:NAD(P)-dependent dehydrogenase (short-subunit alcohol dehydrogenase family)|nr:MAG: D-mannonate oxidoreductase [Spirochaetes bacterium GWC2_52_13]HCG62566.1 D-mannonate oxidoreductase [Sphaerochaeta sp.]HCS35716.1 D-mannonate oxidoreductase [Sphaerochaeta sp.]